MSVVGSWPASRPAGAAPAGLRPSSRRSSTTVNAAVRTAIRTHHTTLTQFCCQPGRDKIDSIPSCGHVVAPADLRRRRRHPRRLHRARRYPGHPRFAALFRADGRAVRRLRAAGRAELLGPCRLRPQPAAGSRLPRLLVMALLFAVAFRVPLAVPPVGDDNDMVRYMYDGRLQRLGYNPFAVIPSDPAVAGTHTDETRLMPSRNAQTPYPAAAQLFFRLVVTIREYVARDEGRDGRVRSADDRGARSRGCGRHEAIAVAGAALRVEPAGDPRGRAQRPRRRARARCGSRSRRGC